ncbi:MAG TPA: transporter substrate-binding domain-containing protein, partial [Solirubrobacteraceae bacterium]|nr:transporter substrate-binding domain-containing protein [Solirubrobacteraceae bacterium]
EPGLYGMAVSKRRPELRDALQTALDQLIRSGEYAEILKRWGVEDGAIKASSVNAGGVATGE